MVARWHRLYFVLEGHKFMYFSDEAEYQAWKGTQTQRPAAIQLHQYEVVLNPGDSNFNFSLQPITNFGSNKSHHFRAAEAGERDKWMESLVAACILVNS